MSYLLQHPVAETPSETARTRRALNEAAGIWVTKGTRSVAEWECWWTSRAIRVPTRSSTRLIRTATRGLGSHVSAHCTAAHPAGSLRTAARQAPSCPNQRMSGVRQLELFCLLSDTYHPYRFAAAARKLM